MFAKTFGCCRKIYNLMLADKIEYYKQTGKSLMTTPAQYKKDYPYLKEVDSLALANAQLHLQSAYKNFFENPKSGFPKFKSARRCRKAYTTNNQKGTVAIFGHYIRLPKAGKVKIILHREPDVSWKLKSATVSQDSDGKYYASVLFEYETQVADIPVSDNAIGLDYKSDGLYMDSEGNTGSGHKFYRESQRKLAKAQRKLRHMTVGSKNYNKQQRKISKIHKKIANQRQDYLHKRSAETANRYDVVCVEDLDLKAMSNKGFGNGKATMDNGYGIFLQMLEYKLSERGKYFIKVDPWYPSSQICSCCGSRKKLDLSERVYHCECGFTDDRDHNAAINIKKEGLRILKAA